MRSKKHQRTRTIHRPTPTDATDIIFAMARNGVGFSFSTGGTLRLSNAAACPSEIWNLFLSGDQLQLCAAVRQVLAGARDPFGDQPEQPKAVAA